MPKPTKPSAEKIDEAREVLELLRLYTEETEPYAVQFLASLTEVIAEL